MSSRTLVFGASLKPERISNKVISRLINYGEQVYAFGMEEGVVNGVVINTECIPISELDTVTLYIGPHRQYQFYDCIISLKPDRVIFNPGSENPEFYQLLKENNIKVEVACSMVLLATNQY